MAVRTPNPLIALSSKPMNLASSLEAGRRDRRSREAFDAAKQDRQRTIEFEDQDRAAQQAEAERKAQEAEAAGVKERAIRDALVIQPYLQSGDLDGAIGAAERRRAKLAEMKKDTQHTDEFIRRLRSGDAKTTLQDVNSIIEIAERFGDLERLPSQSASPNQKSTPFRIQRADGSKAVVTPTFNPDTNTVELIETPFEGEVLSSLGETPDERMRREVQTAGDKKFAELTEGQRAKFMDEAYEQIAAIEGNIGNLRQAVQAIDEGAATGAIISRFTPTVREATVKLENLRNRLGLDVIGAVTFGALSQGELDLALSTALPTNLKPPELKQWINDKIAAQTKLASFYYDAAEFIDQGGTLAGLLRKKRRESGDGRKKAPQAAIDALMANPQLAPDFRAKYGYLPDGF